MRERSTERERDLERDRKREREREREGEGERERGRERGERERDGQIQQLHKENPETEHSRKQLESGHTKVREPTPIHHRQVSFVVTLEEERKRERERERERERNKILECINIGNSHQP